MPAARWNHRKAVLLRPDTHVQEVGSLRGQAFGKRRVERVALLHLRGLPAETARHGHEIRHAGVVAVAVALAMDQLLPLPHHAHVRVVAQHQLHRRAVLARRGELLDVHQHGGIAADADDELFRMRDLRADGGGQAIAHRAGAARGQPALGPLEAEVLGGPHLVLADVGGDDGIAATQLCVQAAHQGLRSDAGAVVVETQTVLRAPGADLLPPAGEPCGGQRLSAQGGMQRVEQLARIADEGQVGLHHLVDGGRVDVEMDDARLRREAVEPAGHAVVETRADADDQVRMMEREVGLQRAVHAGHAEPFVARSRECAEAHQRERAGRLAQPHDVGKALTGGRASVDQAAAAVEHGPPRFGDPLCGAGHAAQVAGARLHQQAPVALQRRLRRGLLLQVLRKIQQHRPRSAAARHLVGVAHQGLNLAGIADLRIPLRHRAADAERITLLEGVGADRGAGHLAADAEDGDRIRQRVEQARRRVAHARPRGHQHHAHATRAARIALRCMDSRLLMAHKDVANAPLAVIFAVQRVVDRQHGAARIAEDGVHAEFGQGVEQDLGTGAAGEIEGGAGGGRGGGGGRQFEACIHRSSVCRSSQKMLLWLPLDL